MKKFLTLVAFLLACGGVDAAQLDAGDVDAELVDATAADVDAELVDAAIDTAADVDAELVDAAADVDAACTPLAAPLALPASCKCEGASVTPCSGGSKGCVWSVGVTSCANGCWTSPLAGSSSCESCVETYNCKCIAPLLGDAGLSSCTCHDGANGPYLVCP